MNEVIIIGKVLSDIDFKFIYNWYKDKIIKKQSINKLVNKKLFYKTNVVHNKEKYKYTSIAKVILKLLNGSIIEVYGYDKIADYIFRNIRKNDIVLCYGLLDSYGKIGLSEINSF